MQIKEYTRYRAEEILPLYCSAGWSNYTQAPDMLQNAFCHSMLVLAAYLDGKLVGILRAVGDGFSVLYIQDLLVYPQCQRRGFGTQLVRTALQHYPQVYQVLLATDQTEGNLAFYRSLGFRPLSELGCCGMILG